MEWIELGKAFKFIRNGKSIKQFGEDGYPITRIETIADRYVDESKVGYANITDIEDYKDFILKKGDILMSHINSEKHLAKTAIFNSDSTLIHGMNLLCLRANSDILDSSYAYYCLNSNVFLNQISNITRKSVNQASFNVTNLKKIKIPVPPLNIQKQIVQVLDEAQGLIDKRKEQIEQLDDLIESVFYEMFGDPVKNEKDWEVKALGKLVENINNGLSRRGKDSDGEIVLRLVELQAGNIDYSDINRIKLEDLEKERYKVNDGDVLFARVNGNPEYVGRCSVFEEIAEDVYFNDHIIRTSFDEGKISGIFLVTLLNSSYGNIVFKEHIKTSAGQFTINQTGIKAINIPIPPISLQNEFAKKVELIEAQKQLMEESLKLFQDNYNSLMQRAFKGELFD